MNDQKLKQRQTARLTSRQIQLMQMIGLSNIEVEERIQSELEVNPALEEGVEEEYDTERENDVDSGEDLPQDEMILGDYASMDDVPEYKLRQVEQHRTPREEIPFAEGSSLQDHLLSQLSLTSLTGEEIEIAKYIVGSLDSDGYLRRDLLSIQDDLAIRMAINTELSTIEYVLSVIRTLDPPGIGAEDLRHCLLLQLERRDPSAAVETAQRILEQMFVPFSNRHYDKIISRLHLTDEELREAIRIITHLNPKPGLDFNTRLEETFFTVVPDFIVEEHDDEFTVSLNNDGIAPVRVNRTFTQQMSEYSGDIRRIPQQKKEVARFVKQKIDDARWFVEALRQRQRTLLFTMQAIVEMQKEYFIMGDVAYLKPLILQDVADATGLDVSTISRVTSTKYVQTPFGTFSLKHFFSEGTMTDDGEEISTRHVKEILAELIAKEDKSSPLSDEAMVARLKENGLNVARRTVAKYREQLGIPVARLRKEI
ncbi:MAG: RNA polymerase factor sigma-54 [Porphyromonas sp.]|nr:RNA polymerase factor sigma-54 [Porphyromonas sp.]